MYSHKIYTCPFFKSDDRLVVRCESGTRMRFPTTLDKIAYTDKHCGDITGWRKCSFAIQLLQYYDEGEQNEKNS
jgi:hypothetical protein